jgi:hypothetical protein
MNATALRVSPDVRASASVDGLVLLDIRGGLLFASNLIGARIWQLLEQRHTREAIAYRLAETFDIPLDRAREDVGAFVDTLVSRGLVEEDAAS